MNQALDNFLGLVSRSDKIIFGVDNLKKVRPQRVKLLLIFLSASQKTQESIVSLAEFHSLEYYRLDPLEVPNFMSGKNLAVMAILDSNIAQKITNLMKEGDTYE